MKIPQVKLETKYVKFDGSYDAVSPPLDMPPGNCRESLNVYHDIKGGKKVFQGYEAFDGQALPSTAIYSVLPLDATRVRTTLTDDMILIDTDILSDGTEVGQVAVAGDTVEQGAASGLVLHVTDDELILGDVSGTFAEGLVYLDTGEICGWATGAQVVDGESDPETRAIYLNLAADAARASIGAIPGSGDVTGIWYYDGDWYGFRDVTDGLSASMYVATATGWEEVSLGYELSFTSGGTTEITEGVTLTGATSAATADVGRVILTSGTWAGGDAAGRLILTDQTGTFQSENLNIGGTTNVATIAGNSTAISFTEPNGRFEFVNTTFDGSADHQRMYGVDGQNRGFEYDGTVFVPIITGMAVDAPRHVAEHKYHLFYSFRGSVQHSSIGEPYEWTPVTGAAEFGMGDDITGFIAVPGDSSTAALAVTCKSRTSNLYGTSVDDWQLIPFKNEAGAIEWSTQLAGNVFLLNDRGVGKLSTSQAYGNFDDATISQIIQPWLMTKKEQLTASCVVKSLNQYWLFFADKTALCCTVDDGEIVAMMPMLFAHKITCACAAETADGEVVMLGAENGYVYKMYSGTSFNGEDIEWKMNLAFNFFGTPTVKKKFRRAIFEVEGDGFSRFFFSYDLEYISQYVKQPSSMIETLGLGSAVWDSGGNFDTGTWDTVSLKQSSFKMYGSARNISLKLSGSSDYCAPIRFSGALVMYNATRLKRT